MAAIQSNLLFESTEDIYRRVFRELRPRTPEPEIRLVYRQFANANSFIRLEGGILEIKVSDVLEGAPAPIQEALAYILLTKLYRRHTPAEFSDRYRRWINSASVRRQLLVVRQVRGRKFVTGGAGNVYDLNQIFEELNQRFFNGLMGRPQLGWSRRASRSMLGHYDPSHNAIVLSRILDRADVPQLAVEYVLYHEMLHLRFPVEHKGARRCVHTAEFKAAEKLFPALAEARAALKRL
ncbi:MAG: SprT-like domain-containing protein [Bryobacteraceae bacterium]